VVAAGIELEISRGQLVCLLGPNGCGKSTLMRSMAGLQPLLCGKVLISGADIQAQKAHERARYLSLVLTDKISTGAISVTEIVAIGRHPHTGRSGRLQAADRKIIEESLEICGLSGFGKRLYSQLSDGEKQRAMIARALAQDTPFMMLDEPTAHLDLPSRIDIMRLMGQLAREKSKAVLLSTHELDLALQWADSIWLMDRQGGINCGVPEDIALGGHLARVFASRGLTFDIESGTFCPDRSVLGNVGLQASGADYFWIARALSRRGYSCAQYGDAVSNIRQIENGKWLYSCCGAEYECDTIAKLLSCLEHEKYFAQLESKLN
jgi:iron complex transport system ATP-binding protein